MAVYVVEPEKRRKKSSHTSTKSSKSRPILKEPSRPPSPVPDSYLQDFAPPSQAVSTQYVDAQSPLIPPTRPQPPSYHTYPAGPPQHPVYQPTPQYLSPYGQPSGYPSVQPLVSHASQSTIRFAPAPPQKPNDGPFREQWDRMDRMAAKSYTNLRDSAGKTVTKMTANYIERPTHMVAMKSMQTLCKGAALCDIISSKFDAVITSIDDEKFSGKEQDLIIYDDQPQPPQQQQPQQQPAVSPPLGESRGPKSNYVNPNLGEQKGSNYFSKVWLYSNSRLPPHLPPFKVYMPTYPLLCLAATYSERVYTPPGSKKAREMETHIPADWRSGTKAMVLKAVPVEDLNTIVFAIRGSQTFMDWAVNYNSAPNSPEDFLDDPGNLCHAGFLYVAKKMVKPVAERLKVLLEENPARSNCSLLITGHSAGGAVAALLYAHMMSTKINSELNYLTSFFKRVHCITFGAPPVSLLALTKPEEKRHRKSLFYSFINEGDPIPRADKIVLRSLLKLYTTPAPSATTLTNTVASTATAPAWPIPVCTLAPAGRLVVLRQVPGSRADEHVEAVTVDADMLGKVVYGDLLKHQMRVYKRRIDEIATRAVTGNVG
ncbi:alpha/beta-hydrolase [Plenodomus tracheiphilus IPT5]|uniref:Alpha/beta-hydrolase n=1 Tax=Plenodomus tracheiphilus IPT5 TaxID=1408161 RepID=A0A6A7BEU4_9PLEO|nr:alpha/beta-hydrolase [Plenodomus tracheiphilus IPT5]